VKDLYDSLGVSKTADAAEIKRAYRKLTQQFHPDKNPGDKAAEERFKDISVAYEVIGDPDKRKLYDEFGEISLTQGFDPARARAYKQARGGFPGGAGGGRGAPGFGGSYGFSSSSDARGASFDDILSQLFGGGRVRDADDLFGAQGRGGPRQPTTQDISGEITIDFTDALLGATVPLRIESRGGAARTLDVKVPQGVVDNSKLRLRGQGSGNPPGDILLTIRVREHRHLQRDGNNLILPVPVTALEAYRGGPIDVPTPWGELTIKLAPGSQNGQTLRLKGKGVQAPGRDPGDLLIKLDVRLPRAGDPALLAALEALQAEEDPRAGFTL
jgi:DnaJ-class molecular chaperone